MFASVASGLSILFSATTIGTSAAFAWLIDSIGLRHDAVVGRDHEHDDVRHLRAARPHLGERLVAGRVDERDHAVVVADACTGTWNALVACVMPPASPAATFAVADAVEQRRLAVVDVTEDGHDRRPRLLVDHARAR